jgi:hypothetical protein
METPDQQLDPKEWNLFIGSSKLSLESVLLRKGNELSSIQIGYLYILHPVVYHVTNVYLGAVNTTVHYFFFIYIVGGGGGWKKGPHDTAAS